MTGFVAQAGGPLEGAAPTPRGRLLVVEDDDGIAEPLVESLELGGFVVERTRTGAEALAAGEADLVLLDLGLPDLDGREVCRRLRARAGADHRGDRPRRRGR